MGALRHGSVSLSATHLEIASRFTKLEGYGDEGFSSERPKIPRQGSSVVVVDRRASIQNRRFLDLSARFPMAWSTAGPLFLGESVSMRVEPL